MKTVVEVDEMDVRYRSPVGEDTPEEKKQGFELSLTQIIGAAVAAAAAAVAASALGVYGTVIGAAVISVVATVGTAVTTSSLHRGREVIQYGVRRTTPWAQTEPGPEVESEVEPAAERPKSWVGQPKQWALIGASSVATLGLALAVITGFELVADSSVSDLTSGRDTGSSTTLGSLISQPANSEKQPKVREPDSGTDSSDGSSPSDVPEQGSTGTGENPTPTAEPTEPTEQPTEPTSEPTAEPTEPETTEPEPTTEPTTPPPTTPGLG